MNAMRSHRLTVLFFLTLCAVLLAEYRSYELGFNPEGKRKIVQDILSENGKLYALRPGTIFVVDQPEVLDRITGLLKDLEGHVPAQIRLSLKRDRLHEKKKRNVDVGVVLKRGGGDVSIGLGEQTSNGLQNNLSQLTTLSGEGASLSLETSEERLRYWRA